MTVLALQCSPGFDLDPLELLAIHVFVDKRTDNGMENVDGEGMGVAGSGACFPSNTSVDMPPSRTPLLAWHQGPGEGNKAVRIDSPV